MPKKLTTEEFIKRAKEIHGDKYDYSLVEYKKTNEKIKIICPIHGVFEQTPSKHVNRKFGCPFCAGRRTNKEFFIKRAKEIYGNKYDYSLVDYKSSDIKVKIICPIHGVFEKTPSNHCHKTNPQGCQKCFLETISEKYRLSFEEFVRRAKEIHGDKYDYSLVDYKNVRNKIKIICPIHGVFEQSAGSHLFGNGCQKCRSSHGEIKIRNFLKKNSIIFEEQKSFKNLGRLRYDFLLPEKNLLIEYNGIQHYEPVETFGGEKKFLYQQHNDELKREFAEKSGIRLLTIPYKDYNIVEKILEEEI